MCNNKKALNLPFGLSLSLSISIFVYFAVYSLYCVVLRAITVSGFALLLVTTLTNATL